MRFAHKLSQAVLAAIVAAGIAFPAPAFAAPSASAPGDAANTAVWPAETSQEAPSAEPAAADPAAFADVIDGVDADGILITLADSSEANLLSANDDGAADDSDAGSAAGELARNLEAAGISLTDQAQDALGNELVVASIADGASVMDAIAAAQSVPGVAKAQPNYVYELIDDVPESTAETQLADNAAITSASTAGVMGRATANAAGIGLLASTGMPNDPYALVSSPDEGNNQYWLYNAGIPDAWDIAHTEGTVTVATLDSGASLHHSDLQENILADYAWDTFTEAPLSPDTGLDGDNAGSSKTGHGSHVAGIIGAVANNGEGIAGASYNARVLPVKITDNSDAGGITTARILKGFSYILGIADELNVRVINLSVGAYGSALGDDATHDVIKQATSRGIAVVCAGGNGGRTDNMYPADFDECIAVTSLDDDGTNSPSSDYNMQKDISAPGASVLSVQAGTIAGYTKKSGTSMAAPIVSGTIALMLSAAPNATLSEICNALYATAKPINDPRNDRSKTSGSHGAIDANAALQALLGQEKKTFSDVYADDWFFGATYRAAYNNVMNGLGDTDRFAPTLATTRAQAAQVLYNYLGGGEIAPACSKNDVDQEQWYTRAVNWCVSSGIMTGYSDDSNNFGVDDELTREQMAKVMAIAAGADVESADRTKFDALSGTDEASAWAEPFLIWATDKDIINGIDNHDGTRALAPRGAVERCQTAQIMMNAIDQGVF